MIDLEGVDIWSIDADAHVVTTNGYVTARGEAVMGRGCARQARDRFPGVARLLGRQICTRGNRVHDLGGDWEYCGRRYRLVAFPVKRDWREKALLRLIAHSAWELKRLADVVGWELIVLPRPGCGNGRLVWSAVRPVIEAALDDRFLVVSF